MNMMKTMRSVQIASLALTGMAVAPHAWADSLPAPMSQFVNGSFSATENFSVSTAGTVTVNIIDTGWYSPLSSLSFEANSATQELASYNSSNVSGGDFSFQVGPGDYFATIMATAGGPKTGMNLGLFSLNMTFAPVPLPTSGWLLLTGMLALFGVVRAVRPQESMGTAEA